MHLATTLLFWRSRYSKLLFWDIVVIYEGQQKKNLL